MNRKPAVAAWTRLVRVYQSVDHASERNFRSLGLNSACFDVLARVRSREGMTQNELAEALLVTKGNISQLVTKLVGTGWLERRAEGRTQRLFLTDAGREVADKAIPRQEALLAQSLRALSPSELQELIRLLRKWERT